MVIESAEETSHHHDGLLMKNASTDVIKNISSDQLNELIDKVENSTVSDDGDADGDIDRDEGEGNGGGDIIDGWNTTTKPHLLVTQMSSTSITLAWSNLVPYPPPSPTYLVSNLRTSRVLLTDKTNSPTASGAATGFGTGSFNPDFPSPPPLDALPPPPSAVGLYFSLVDGTNGMGPTVQLLANITAGGACRVDGLASGKSSLK